jgi:hypothetical protein
VGWVDISKLGHFQCLTCIGKRSSLCCMGRNVETHVECLLMSDRRNHGVMDSGLDTPNMLLNNK